MMRIVFGNHNDPDELGRREDPPVRSWNMVDDDGAPVPLPRRDTIEFYDKPMLIQVVNGFITSSQPRRVPRPLSKPSDSTPTPQVPPMTTVALSDLPQG